MSRAGCGAGQGKDILKAEPRMTPPLGTKAPCLVSLSCEGQGCAGNRAPWFPGRRSPQPHLPGLVRAWSRHEGQRLRDGEGGSRQRGRPSQLLFPAATSQRRPS